MSIAEQLRIELPDSVTGSKRYLTGDVESLRSFATYMSGVIARIPKGGSPTMYEVFPPQIRMGRITEAGPLVEVRLYVDHYDTSQHWIGIEPGAAIAGEAVWTDDSSKAGGTHDAAGKTE